MAPDPTKPDAAALAAQINTLLKSAVRSGPWRDDILAKVDRLAALARRPESAGEGAEVELSEDEIMECWEGCSDPAHPEVSIIALARAIERAHGITNSTKGDAR